MQIENEGSIIAFEDVPCGDVFRFDNTLLMKIIRVPRPGMSNHCEPTDFLNVVDIICGATSTFENCVEVVHLPNAVLRVGGV